jgi:hypothetical protein
MTDNSLLQVLNARLDVAKRFTKEYQQLVKEWIELYEAETPKAKTIEDIVDRDRRYQYTAKTVFDNVEKYRSSFFEKPPEVMYAKKGKMDEEKALKVTSAWEYLKDKTNFKQFMDDSFTYFALGGFTVGHVGYKKEIETQVGEDGVEYTNILADDPILEVYDHENEWFMPDSIFSPDAKQVTYFRKKKLSQSQALEAFGVKVDPDESILTEDIDAEKSTIKSELSKCGIFYYTGTLPKKDLVEYINAQAGIPAEESTSESEVADMSETKDIFYVAFSKNKVLKVDKSPIGEQTCALGRWYSLPKKFFGFGLGKQLEEEQRQESIRTGQLIRYADQFAYPKLAINLKDAGTDPKALMDRNNMVIQFIDNKPEYLSPPAANGAINAMMGKNSENIQTNSGLADLSKMQESKTMETATGQTQVADSNEKRIKVAKDKYYEFLKQIIIKVFKYAQAEWQEEKVRYITDENGETQEITIAPEDFADIDFDTDISVDFESMSVNKDVIRQQSIVLYDKVKDDPIVDRKKVFKKMLSDGFGEKNPDMFIKESNIAPGMKFIGEDDQEYVADDSGTLVPLQDEAMTAESSGESAPASDQSAVQANAMTV